MKPSVVIAGCGDVGTRLGVKLAAEGWTVYGLRRHPENLPSALIPLAADLADTACPSAWPRSAPNYLVFCATPDTGTEAAYRATYVEGLQHVLGWLEQTGQKPYRVLFVSTRSVYGLQEGEWVDETSPCMPEGYSGRIMLEAEEIALNSHVPATVVRMAGIYGPGREWLLNQVRAGYQVPASPPQYGNRIHADDAAGLLAFLLQKDDAATPLAPLYLGVDNSPVPLHDVVTGLRDLLGVTHTGTAAVIRRAGSKRCRNTRARRLGWEPHYPSWREGYAALLAGQPLP